MRNNLCILNAQMHPQAYGKKCGLHDRPIYVTITLSP